MFKDNLEKHYIVLKAIDEDEKFEHFMECAVWFVEVKTVHENLLHATKLDYEIKSNAGTTFKMLQRLLEQYGRYYTAQAAVKKKLDVVVKFYMIEEIERMQDWKVSQGKAHNLTHVWQT